MPELPSRCAMAHLRRMSLLAACALSLGGLPAAVFAQNVSPALRACAADPDPGQRLDCYDREMKRLLAPTASAATAVPAAPAATPAPAAPAASAPPAAPAAYAPAPAAPAQLAKAAPPAAPAGTPAATPSTITPTEGAGSAPAAARRTPAWKRFFSGGPDSEVKAQIVRLDRWPNAMVLHLDNGQVWRQVGRASGDLSLHTGERVSIEKHLGSYWLSSGHVSNMQVRLEPR